jgi:hypothetical protein
VAAVDDRHQIIVEAQADGTGSEQELLLPVTAAIQPIAKEHTVVCADTGYHSEDSLKQLEEERLEAYIPDNLYCRSVMLRTGRRPLRTAGRAAG